MASIAIRQSGGANIVSIPKAIVKTLGLSVGSRLDLTLEDNRIILTPVDDKLTLEAAFSREPERMLQDYRR